MHAIVLSGHTSAKSIPDNVAKAVRSSTVPSENAYLVTRVQRWLLESPSEMRKATCALSALSSAAAVVNTSLHRKHDVDSALEAACLAALVARPRPCSAMRTYRGALVDAARRALADATAAAAAVLPQLEAALRVTVSDGVRGRGDVVLRAKVVRVDDTTQPLVNKALDAAVEVGEPRFEPRALWARAGW